jgi:hypothetical protein
VGHDGIGPEAAGATANLATEATDASRSR